MGLGNARCAKLHITVCSKVHSSAMSAAAHASVGLHVCCMNHGPVHNVHSKATGVQLQPYSLNKPSAVWR